jgi:hypothetical protein
MSRGGKLGRASTASNERPENDPFQGGPLHCKQSYRRAMRVSDVARSALTAAMLASAVACVDPRCPKGYLQDGDTCYRKKDAGTSEGAVVETDADPVAVRDASSGDAAQESDAAGPGEPPDTGAPDAEGSSDAGEVEVGRIDSGECTGTGCPECDDRNACTGAHEICVDGQCVVQPYCGDGKKGADEECDPRHPSWDAWSCDSSCKATTAYLPCSGNETEPQGGCAIGETCLNGQCIRRCNVPGDCPAAPPGATVTTSCFVDVFGGCMAVGCTAATDCPPGLVCVYNSSPLFMMNICVPCTLATACPVGQECKFRSGSDKFRRCM